MGLVGTAGGQSWRGRAAGLATADAGMSCQHDQEASQSNQQQHLPSIRDSATPVCSRGTDAEPAGEVSAPSLLSPTPRTLLSLLAAANKAALEGATREADRSANSSNNRCRSCGTSVSSSASVSNRRS